MNADIFGLNVKTKCPGRNKNSFDIERCHSLLSLFNWIWKNFLNFMRCSAFIVYYSPPDRGTGGSNLSTATWKMIEISLKSADLRMQL